VERAAEQLTGLVPVESAPPALRPPLAP
jgi:hypothetical protein